MDIVPDVHATEKVPHKVWILIRIINNNISLVDCSNGLYKIIHMRWGPRWALRLYGCVAELMLLAVYNCIVLLYNMENAVICSRYITAFTNLSFSIPPGKQAKGYKVVLFLYCNNCEGFVYDKGPL